MTMQLAWLQFALQLFAATSHCMSHRNTWQQGAPFLAGCFKWMQLDTLATVAYLSRPCSHCLTSQSASIAMLQGARLPVFPVTTAKFCQNWHTALLWLPAETRLC
jgi:hypothetical protein